MVSSSVIVLHKVLNSSGTTLAASLALLLLPLFSDLTLLNIKSGATQLITLVTAVKKRSFLNKMFYCEERSEQVSADSELLTDTCLRSRSWVTGPPAPISMGSRGWVIGSTGILRGAVGMGEALSSAKFLETNEATST